MGIWQQFPFTNFHEENLDWFLECAQDLNARMDKIDGEGGAATKDYVNGKFNEVAKEINRVETECDQSTNNISRDLNTESETRQTADEMIEQSVQRVDTKVTGLSTSVGDWTQPVTLSNAVSAVQETSGKSANAIHGAGGTYDLSKGTIQARLNSLEEGEELNVEKATFSYLTPFIRVNVDLAEAVVGAKSTYVFANAVEIVSTSSPISTNSFIYIEPWNKNANTSLDLSFLIAKTESQKITGNIYVTNPTGSNKTFVAQTVSLILAKRLEQQIVTHVSGNVISGGAGDVTKSYVDSQDAALDAKITTAQQTADSAVTMATDADDKAEQAKSTAQVASSTASNAKTIAETAQTEASGATSSAQTANNNATAALTAIGSKSSAVTFSNIWNTIGAWNESATITARLKDAYNWAWNSRSAINGTDSYPTDKASINQRLNTLEDTVPSTLPKIASGNGTLRVTTGRELVVDYANSGFTSVPVVVASYSKEGENDTETAGTLKVFDITTTGCKITMSSGNTKHDYNVGWIATGN